MCWTNLGPAKPSEGHSNALETRICCQDAQFWRKSAAPHQKYTPTHTFAAPTVIQRPASYMGRTHPTSPEKVPIYAPSINPISCWKVQLPQPPRRTAGWAGGTAGYGRAGRTGMDNLDKAVACASTQAAVIVNIPDCCQVKAQLLAFAGATVIQPCYLLI